MPCPCGSSNDYDACCQPFHSSDALPPTAEALMRSRYCAFVKQEITYLCETMWPANRKPSDEVGYADRAANSVWLGLTIHETDAGSKSDTRGTVSFTAKFMTGGQVHDQAENSLFRKKDRQWYYVKPVG